MNIKRFSATIILLSAIALVFPMITPVAPSPAGPNIMIISWDGVQRDHLEQLLRDERLPSLAALIKEGKYLPLEISTHQTDTKAGHTEMLTGYPPEVTGVYSNKNYGPIPEGLSDFERVENYFGDENVVTIALTSKSGHIGSRPAGPCQAAKPAKKKKNKKKSIAAGKTASGEAKQCPAEPWNIVKNHIDIWDGDLQRNSSIVGPLALQYLLDNSQKRFFFFLHLSDPDSAGHKYGENSAEYEQGITACDSWLSRVREQLLALGISGNTLIYVTTDHGFDEGQHTHKNAPHTWMATNDTRISAAEGNMKDVSPTLLKAAGVPLDSFVPPLPGKPLF